MRETPKSPVDRWLLRGVFFFFALVLILVYIYVINSEFRDLVRPNHCLFYRLTGFLCPACGGTRAMIHLLRGDLLLSLKSNTLAVLILPLILYAMVIILRLVFDRSYSIDQVKIAPFWIWSGFTLIVLFWIIRNIPGFVFLRPYL